MIISESATQKPEFNSQLIQALAKSFYWNKLLISGKANNNKDIQKMENFGSDKYIRYILKLRFHAFHV
jgi:hypothetical protein